MRPEVPGAARYRVGLLVGVVLLAACAVDDAARTDQALGRGLSVNAWMDPGIEPLAGCAALVGEWSNQGSLVRDQGIKPALLGAALGLAEDDPDAAFADAARFTPTPDGGLSIAMTAAGREIRAVNLTSAQVDCGDPSMAVLDYHGARRVAVDATGALWVEEHRFPRPGVGACGTADFWGRVSPDGMATVVTGGFALLWDPGAGDVARVDEPITGVNVPPRASFWMPGAQRLPARVTFKARSEWVMRLETALAELPATLEPCHVYALYGHSEAPDRAGVSLFDLGDDFAWRECPLTETRGGRAPVFNGRELLLPEACFGVHKDWRARMGRPPRSLAPLARIDLTAPGAAP